MSEPINFDDLESLVEEARESNKQYGITNEPIDLACAHMSTSVVAGHVPDLLAIARAASRVVDNSYSINPDHTRDSMRGTCTPTCVACGLGTLRDLLGGYSWRRGAKKDAS
jgi:hypothetical protein